MRISEGELAREDKKHKESVKKRARMSLEKADNGGFVVEHDNDEYPRPKNAFGNHKEMFAHIKEHTGDCGDPSCCGSKAAKEDKNAKGEMK